MPACMRTTTIHYRFAENNSFFHSLDLLLAHTCKIYTESVARFVTNEQSGKSRKKMFIYVCMWQAKQRISAKPKHDCNKITNGENLAAMNLRDFLFCLLAKTRLFVHILHVRLL